MQTVWQAWCGKSRARRMRSLGRGMHRLDDAGAGG
jgi:hypothetical protein